MILSLYLQVEFRRGSMLLTFFESLVMMNLVLFYFPFLLPLYYSFRKFDLAEYVNNPERVVTLMYVFLSDPFRVAHLPLSLNDPEGVMSLLVVLLGLVVISGPGGAVLHVCSLPLFVAVMCSGLLYFLVNGPGGAVR